MSKGKAGPSTAPSPAKNVRVVQKLLQVSTHQMVVLLMFNEREEWTFGELLETTQLAEKHLKRTLQSVALGKMSQRVLVRRGTGMDMEKENAFFVNDNFTSSLTRIKVQAIAATHESETVMKSTHMKVSR